MKKRIGRQVGYLQRLYRDARSTEHKILQKTYLVNTLRTGDADLRFYVTTVQDG